jgi:hypothetical protein
LSVRVAAVAELGWLQTKAFTYECAACGRQTSVTAGTIMRTPRLSRRRVSLEKKPSTALHLADRTAAGRHDNGVVLGCAPSCAGRWSTQSESR